MSVVNAILGKYLRLRMSRLGRFMENPKQVQEKWLSYLIHHARKTEWGKMHGFASMKTPEDYSARVPIQDYESLKPYISRMMLGEKSVLWDGEINWYSKSSGTTSDKSKYIPVSWEHHRKCLMRGSKDTLSLYYHNNPNANIFQGKGIVMGGTWEPYSEYPKTKIGDVSALMLQHMPAIAKYFYTPDFDTAMMKEWESKIAKMANITSKQQVTNLGGVPTWTIVLFREILRQTGKSNMLEVWKDLEIYIHGGVSFEPYKEQFKQFFPGNQVSLMEIYNASEGYFAIQSDLKEEGMLLMLDNGIYYEFIPASEWNKDFPNAIPLWEVEKGKNYAMVISTNSGLWRYNIGDTVMFTSISPYKIKVTGRTKHFINTFGEEVMVDNTDRALALACQYTNATVEEYTVAPIYFKGNDKGGHKWLIEFGKEPEDMDLFTKLLDQNLQKINSDYEAKRYKNLALNQLKIQAVPKKTFHNWMKGKGKYGGQNKVPRLANHRRFVDEILEMID